MKLALLALPLALLSTEALALSDADVARFCSTKGREKIALQAAAWGCEVDLESTQATEVDNRWYKPSAYVWYAVKADCHGYSVISQLVQYYRGECI